MIQHINGIKDKYYLTISVDAEKAFNKIPSPFMTEKKKLNKLIIVEAYLNIIKAMYNKPTAIIILNDERLKTVPLRSGTR